MKKQLVSILTAGCLMAAMVPAAFAADATMSEEALKSAVAKGGTVDLTGDVTLNSTLEIKDGVIIDGNGYTITYTPNTQTYAIDIQTNDAVKFQDITIDATAGNMTNGIVVQNCVPHLTLDNTELNVMRFGISFTPTGADSTLDVVNNSAILNRRVNDYATEAVQPQISELETFIFILVSFPCTLEPAILMEYPNPLISLLVILTMAFVESQKVMPRQSPWTASVA